LGVGLFGGLAIARAANCPSNPDGIGTHRVMSIDPAEHPLIGTIQYRDTLPLANKEVVLTFDDGPLPPYTNRVLEILAAECVKANYFIIGRMARGYPELLKRIHAEGHVIGTHSENHPLAFNTMQLPAVQREIEQGIASTGAALGKPDAIAPFFRIPGLLRADGVEAYLRSRRLVTWGADIPGDDWKHISASEVVRRTITRLDEKGRGIILLHDIQPATALALPTLLKELNARGYRIVQVRPAGAAAPLVASRAQAPAPTPMPASAWPTAMAPTRPAVAKPTPTPVPPPRPVAATPAAPAQDPAAPATPRSVDVPPQLAVAPANPHSRDVPAHLALVPAHPPRPVEVPQLVRTPTSVAVPERVTPLAVPPIPAAPASPGPVEATPTIVTIPERVTPLAVPPIPAAPTGSSPVEAAPEPAPDAAVVEAPARPGLPAPQSDPVVAQPPLAAPAPAPALPDTAAAANAAAAPVLPEPMLPAPSADSAALGKPLAPQTARPLMPMLKPSHSIETPGKVSVHEPVPPARWPDTDGRLSRAAVILPAPAKPSFDFSLPPLALRMSPEDRVPAVQPTRPQRTPRAIQAAAH
jgi:peptidoglycan/xylan/chitin deacetylase (PgdA/CDA1 family)